MKLLLTSAGFANRSIVKALLKLTNKPFNKLTLAFIPTTANVESGGKEWLIEDLSNCKSLGFKEVDIVDISALPKSIWKKRLDEADIFLFGEGNTFHLMHWVQKSGLQKLLPTYLKSKVYMGISAGSCIVGPTIYNSVQNLFGEKYDLMIQKGLKLVDFQFIPHLNSKYFKKIRIKNLEKASRDIKEPVYALDDVSAIVINNKEIEVISEGKWKRFK